MCAVCRNYIRKNIGEETQNLNKLSVCAIPVMIGSFILFGFVRRVNVYDCFTEGAKEGLLAMLNVIVPLIGLMVAISMFRASGALELTARALSPLIHKIGITDDVLPLALLRPISGSAGTAIVTDILKNCGPDSLSGRMASIMMGSTETTFYTVAVYFGAVGIKRVRHTLAAALLADITGITVSAFLANIWFV